MFRSSSTATTTSSASSGGEVNNNNNTTLKKPKLGGLSGILGTTSLRPPGVGIAGAGQQQQKRVGIFQNLTNQARQQLQSSTQAGGFKKPAPFRPRPAEEETKQQDSNNNEDAAVSDNNNNATSNGPTVPSNGAAAASKTAASDAKSLEDAALKEAQKQVETDEPLVSDVISRIGPSFRHRLYFFINFAVNKNKDSGKDNNNNNDDDETSSTDGKKKNNSKNSKKEENNNNNNNNNQQQTLDKTGIAIVDSRNGLTFMFDRSGRTVGSQNGSFLKESVDTLVAGKIFRVGNRYIETLTAIHEEAFRTGEFFLRSDHQQRIREAKLKAIAEKVAAEKKEAVKPKMSLGGDQFASVQFKKRPANTGWVVPLAGRIKDKNSGNGLIIGGDLVPLHDPDADDAVVLFRADYKRDLQGNRIVSVVIDPVLGHKLRPHQRIGVKFLYDCVTGEKVPGFFGAILADSMGLGKSIQAVSTIWTCLKQGKYGRPVTRKAMVVAPSSLCANWGKEFSKWLGEGTVKVFCISESSPKGDRILSRFEGEGDVLVISYDQLRKYVDRLKVMRSIDLIVCDEGHRLKNAEIKTTRAVDMMPTRRRIVLSGTPIQNDLGEFHAMVGFVNPGILGNIDLFTRVYQEPIMRGREPNADDEVRELGSDRANFLAKMTQKFILRRTAAINEKYLPAKVDMVVFCRLGVEQEAVYERVHALSEQFSSAPLVLITALKKLCNHVDLLHEAVKSETSQLKLPASVLPKGYRTGNVDGTFGSKVEFTSLMLDQLPKYGDKLVIVSNYTQTLHVLAKLCEKKNVAYFQLDGSTPIKKRQELVDRFNIPTQREIVFLLSSKAGGVGLNLIGANRLILFDPDWNPANDAQAMGRVWRDGQKKKCFLYRLLCTGTIEEKIYQRQVSKEGLSANVIDMQQDSKQHFSSEELKALFDFRKDTACDTHDLLGCKCNYKRDPSAAPQGFKRVVPKKEGQSGPRMDELKSWQHVEKPSGFALDAVVQSMTKVNNRLVSFIFANERDQEKIKAEEVKQEKVLESYEDQITCSQEDGKEQGIDDEEEEVLLGLSQHDEDDEEGHGSSSNNHNGGGGMMLDDE